MNQTTITRSTIGSAPNAAPAAPEAPAAAEASEAGPADPSGTAPTTPETPARPTSEASPPAAEAKPEPEPDKTLDLVTRFDKLARREARVRRTETEITQLRSDLESKSKQFDAKMAEFEQFMSDPVGYALQKGKDPVELAKRFAQAETEEQKEIRLIKEQLAEGKRQQEEAQKEAQARAAQHAHVQSMRAFVETIIPDECPNLTALYQAPEIPGLVKEFLARPLTVNEDGRAVRKTMLQVFRDDHGRDPNAAEVREALEYEASLRATRIVERSKMTSASPSGQPNSQASSTNGNGQNGISNQHAATASTGARKPKLSKELERLQRLEELKADMRAEDTTE